MLLLDAQDSQSRFDEMRGLEVRNPGEVFSRDQLVAMLEILRERPKGSYDVAEACSQACLYILLSYELRNLLSEDLSERFIGVIEEIFRSESSLLKSHIRGAVSKLARLKPQALVGCSALLSSLVQPSGLP